MTIVDVACWRDRALIGADSVMCRAGCELVRDARGAPIHDDKLVHLPRAHCVVSMTGSLHLRNHLRDALQDAAGFDEIVERAPGILRDAPHHVAATPRDRYGQGSTAIVVGWSMNNECMCVADFKSERGFACALHVSPSSGATYWVGPSIPLPEFCRYPVDAAGMLGLAELQVAHFRGEHTDAPLGGRFTVATLTRAAIAFEVVGDLGLPSVPLLETAP